jgi:hypothetical protein
MNSSNLRAFVYFISIKIWHSHGSFAPAVNNGHSRHNSITAMTSFMGQTLQWMRPRIGMILLFAFWAIPAGWTTNSIPEKPGIVPESGPHLNAVLPTIPEYWQPNSAIVQPIRIGGKSTARSPIKCYVHGLSPISVTTLEAIYTDNSLPDGRTDTYLSVDLNPSTNGKTEIRSFIIYTDTDILFENAGATKITVTAEVGGVSPFNTATTLPITVSGSGLASAVDFAPVASFNIVVPSGATSGSATFTLTPENDLVDETDETITVASTSSLVNGTDEISLRDDDTAPTGISLDATPTVAHEDEGEQVVTVTATVDGRTTFATAQSIPITVTGTLAAGAVDFAPVPGFSIEIPAENNSGSATFTLTPENDSVDETDETITIASSNAAVSNSITFLLRDDDSAPREINILTDTNAIYENLGAQDIRVTLEVSGSTTYATDQTVPFTVTGTGAPDVVGFEPVTNFSIVLPAQALSASSTLTITPINNSVDEANETITLASSSPEVTESATINLIDDDPTPSITLNAAPATISEADGATQITVIADLEGQVVFPIDQTISLSINGSGTDAAVDFTSVNSLDLRIAAGTNGGTATFTLTPVDDSEDEVDEVVTISSTNSLVSTSATITLTDDDATPSIRLSATPGSVREDDGPTEITVTATVDGATTFGAPQILPINVSGSDVPAAVDFAPVADFNLSIDAGSSTGSATFILTPENDTENELDELITVASTSPLATNHTTVTLIDDDDAQVVLSVAPETVHEDRGTQTVSVTGTLEGNRAFSTDRIVTLSISGSGDPYAVDFEPVADIDLVIRAGLFTATAMFDLTPIDDLEFESDETITVSSTDAIVTAPVYLTLANDDTEPEGIVLEASPNVIKEDAGLTRVTVTANVRGETHYSTDQKIVLAITDDGDPTSVAYTSVNEITLTIPAGTASGSAEFDITPESNNLHQPDGIVTIGSSSTLVLNTTDLTLENDDVAPTGIVLSARPTSILEDAGPTKVTITANVQGETRYSTDQEIVLDITDDGDPTTVAYTSVNEITLTIPAGAASANAEFDITPENNNVHQPNGTVTIGSSSTLVLNTTDLTIENDDAVPTGIVLSAQPTSISEDAGPIPINITAAVQGGTTYAIEQSLTVTASSSGQIYAVDYDAIPDFAITIPAESNSASTIIELIPENDQEDEQDETITFSSTNPLVTQGSSITIVDDDQAPTGIAVTVSPDVVAENSGPTEVTVSIRVTGGTRYAEEKMLTLSIAGSGLPGAVGFAPISPIMLSLLSGEDMVSTTFSLKPVDNLLDEPDEILTIAVAGDDVGAEAQLSLTDDDPEPAGFALTVTPEIVMEGDGPTTIRVTATVVGISRYSTMQTLDISVADAIAGAVGYENIPDFTIEVAPGADSGTNTFILTPNENTVRETDATITITALHLSETINTRLLLRDDDQATVRASDVNAALLPEATRAIIASAVGAVNNRIDRFRNTSSASAGNFSSTLSGLMMRFRDGTPYGGSVAASTWIPRLGNSSLAASLNGRITVWGHADYRSLSGNNTDYPLGYDGNVSGFHAGADMTFGRFLVGISASQFDGDLDYEYSGNTGQVNLRAPLKGLYQIDARTLSPYVNWSWNANSGIWTMASFGAGDVELSDPDMASEQSETSLQAFAAGVDLRLITAQSGFSLTVKGAAWTGQMELDENSSRISGLAVNVRRIQMSFEGAYRIGLASKGVFQPFIEAGMRGDGGDGQTGLGLELGGGARLALPSAGLRFTGQGRALVAHKGNIDEWGFGGMLSYSHGDHTGPTLELGSYTGHTLGGTQKIWNDAAWFAEHTRGRAKTRLQSLLGYGFALTAGTVMPYTGIELERGVNTRMGAEYRLGDRLSVRLEASNRVVSPTHNLSPVVHGSITLR